MISDQAQTEIVEFLNGEFRDPSNNPYIGLRQLASLDELPKEDQYHEDVGIIVVNDKKKRIDYLTDIIARRWSDHFECEGTIRNTPSEDEIEFGDSRALGGLDHHSAGYEISESAIQSGNVYLLTRREPEKQLGLFDVIASQEKEE